MRGILKTYHLIKVLVDFLTLTVVYLAVRYYLFVIHGVQFLVSAGFFILVIILILWYIISRILPLYDEPGNRFFSSEFTILIKVIIAQSILLSFILFFIEKEDNYPRTFLVIYTFSIGICLTIEKYILHYIFKKENFNSNKNTKVLIVGAGNLGLHFYDAIVKNEKYGYVLAGFVDDVKKPNLNGTYLGRIEALEDIIKKHEIAEVIIALPSNAVEKIERTIYLCERNAKRVRIIPDYYRFGSGNFRISNLGNFPLITVRSLPLDDLENRFFKRSLDLFFSIFFLLFFFSWLFPVIAILIKLNSKGPVFFKQQRWGLNNKKISCLKFRSMKIDSTDFDENGKYRQATKNDERVTAIGNFLRKTSLDELPQLLNVLTGDMSFVGPRPHPIPLNIESKDIIQNYMLRHLVKPGMTGWAQVNGARGETNTKDKMQKRINFDLWYIENWSIWLDIEIIAQTIVIMLKGDSQAY